MTWSLHDLSPNWGHDKKVSLANAKSAIEEAVPWPKTKKRAALEMDIKNMWNARLLGLGGGFKYAFILTPMMGYLWQLHVEEEWSWNWFFLSIFVHVKKNDGSNFHSWEKITHVLGISPIQVVSMSNDLVSPPRLRKVLSPKLRELFEVVEKGEHGEIMTP